MIRRGQAFPATTKMSHDRESLPLDLPQRYPVLPRGAARLYPGTRAFHYFEHHTATIRGVQIGHDLPGAACSDNHLIGGWIEPSSGEVVARVQVPPGRQTLDVPPLLVDLALLVTSEPDRLHLRRAGSDPTSHVREGGTP
jgi:hypothetical protein